jgi:hypothetical protein
MLLIVAVCSMFSPKIVLKTTWATNWYVGQQKGNKDSAKTENRGKIKEV